VSYLRLALLLAVAGAVMTSCSRDANTEPPGLAQRAIPFLQRADYAAVANLLYVMRDVVDSVEYPCYLSTRHNPVRPL
jgi:hypothetical protein